MQEQIAAKASFLLKFQCLQDGLFYELLIVRALFNELSGPNLLDSINTLMLRKLKTSEISAIPDSEIQKFVISEFLS